MTTRPRTETAPLDGLALGAALVTVFFWASAFVGIRSAGTAFSPAPLAFGRLAVGVLALGVLLAWRRDPLPRGRLLVLTVLSGLLWQAESVALNAGEQLVDAGTAAMLVNTGPILIAVFAGLFLREGFPARLLAGCAIAFAGAVVISYATTSGSTGTDAGLGIALCLIAAVLYAAGVTLQKPVVASTSPLSMTWVACAVAAVATLPFGPQLVEEIGRAPVDAIAWLVYLGIFPTAVAFTTWAFALSRTSAGRLGSTSYLVPPIAIALGWLVLGEVPPALAIAGGVVCIAGVVVARSGGPRRSAVPAPVEG